MQAGLEAAGFDEQTASGMPRFFVFLVRLIVNAVRAVYRFTWATHKVTIEALDSYIERFYNTRRMHSFIGFKSPLEYELQTADWRAAA